MLPYYVLIGMPIFFSVGYELIYEKRNRLIEKKNYTIAVFFTLYFVLIAFRSALVGVDTKRYLFIYNTISKYAWKDLFYYYDHEQGFVLLNKLISSLLGSEQWLLIITAAICVIPIAILYYKESRNSLISMALFLVMPVFQMSFSGIRQAIAIALVVPAVHFIKEKSVLKFLLIVLLAFLFHKSAFIMLFLYPLYYVKLNWKHLFLLAPAVLVVYIFKAQLFAISIQYMSRLFNETYEGAVETGAYTMFLVYIAFSAYAFLIADDEKMDESAKGFRNYLVLATFLQTFAMVSPLAMRMNYYFIIFIPLVISQTTHYCTKFNKRSIFFIELVTFLVFIIYFVDKIQSTDSLGIYPYEFFWGHM